MYWCLLGVSALFYVLLMYQMRKYHNYEFNRIHKQMTINFLVTVIVLVYFNALLHLDQLTFEKYQSAILGCFESSMHKSFYIRRIVIIISNVFQLEYLLLIYNVVHIKSTQDILQGLNKLDYFIKYSYFQIYKDDMTRQKKRSAFNSSGLSILFHTKST